MLAKAFQKGQVMRAANQSDVEGVRFSRNPNQFHVKTRAFIFIRQPVSVITSGMKPQGLPIGNQKVAPREAKESSTFPYSGDFILSCIVQGCTKWPKKWLFSCSKAVHVRRWKKRGAIDVVLLMKQEEPFPMGTVGRGYKRTGSHPD